MERVIDCPICYDQDSCFEDTQEKFESYMCFNCGFMSSSYYTEENSNKIENQPQLVSDLKLPKLKKVGVVKEKPKVELPKLKKV